MRARNGAGATHHIDDADARGFEQLGGPLNSLDATETLRPQAGAIRAKIIGEDSCPADGIVVHGSNAPILLLCRKLIAAGLHPDQPLHAYRNDVCCIVVRSIGEGAKLTVKERREGPVFEKYCPFCPPVAPLVRSQEGGRHPDMGAAP